MNENILELVKLTAGRIKEKWPNNSDGEKASRAIAAYELGLVELMRIYSHTTALKILDPNKGMGGGGRSTMFNVSERAIRRVENIRQFRSAAASALESAAMRGELSLELVEWIVMHPPSVDTLEAIWLAASDEARAQFLKRIHVT